MPVETIAFSTRQSLTGILGKALPNTCVPLNTDAAISRKTAEGIVRSNDQKSMSIDELWELHADVIFEFDQKLLSEEIELEQRLRHIRAAYRSRRPTRLQRFDA